MVLIWKNNKTGKTVNVNMLTPKYEDMKQEDAFKEAMDDAMEQAKRAIALCCYNDINGNKEELVKAQAKYAAALVTLLSLAHAASDKGLYCSYNEKEFTEMVRSIEDALCATVQKAGDEAHRKVGKRA